MDRRWDRELLLLALHLGGPGGQHLVLPGRSGVHDVNLDERIDEVVVVRKRMRAESVGGRREFVGGGRRRDCVG